LKARNQVARQWAFSGTAKVQVSDANGFSWDYVCFKNPEVKKEVSYRGDCPINSC
jgi:hypothetical protein